MNYSVSYSNNGDVASAATWPNPWALGDYLYDPYAYPSVLCGTILIPHLLQGIPTAVSYTPDVNAADDAAFSLCPTTAITTNRPLEYICRRTIQKENTESIHDDGVLYTWQSDDCITVRFSSP